MDRQRKADVRRTLVLAARRVEVQAAFASGDMVAARLAQKRAKLAAKMVRRATPRPAALRFFPSMFRTITHGAPEVN